MPMHGWVFRDAGGGLGGCVAEVTSPPQTKAPPPARPPLSAVVFIIEHALLVVKFLLMRSSDAPTLKMAEKMASQEEFDMEMIAEKAKKKQ